MKFNKGQGALEYLLLIGGAVLIAVIVIALLVGMGSQNASDAKTRNDEAMDAIDTPIPSTITNVQCSGSNTIISWTPIFKTGYTYTLTKNGSNTGMPAVSSTTNPILVSTACVAGDVFVITTTSGSNTVTSNAYTVSI